MCRRLPKSVALCYATVCMCMSYEAIHEAILLLGGKVGKGHRLLNPEQVGQRELMPCRAAARAVFSKYPIDFSTHPLNNQPGKSCCASYVTTKLLQNSAEKVARFSRPVSESIHFLQYDFAVSGMIG